MYVHCVRHLLHVLAQICVSFFIIRDQLMQYKSLDVAFLH